MAMPIDTQALTLRPFVPADLAAVFRMSREESSRIWLPSQVYRDLAHAEEELAYLIAQCEDPADPRKGPYVLGVEVRRTGELVGHVGLSPYKDSVEVGFAIAEAQQRQGFASEAVRATCEWACAAFALPEILGIAAAENVASQGVLRRAGFVWQRDEFLRFQSVDQPVRFYAFPGRA